MKGQIWSADFVASAVILFTVLSLVILAFPLSILWLLWKDKQEMKKKGWID